MVTNQLTNQLKVHQVVTNQLTNQLKEHQVVTSQLKELQVHQKAQLVIQLLHQVRHQLQRQKNQAKLKLQRFVQYGAMKTEKT